MIQKKNFIFQKIVNRVYCLPDIITTKMNRRQIKCPKDDLSTENRSSEGETMTSSDYEAPFIKKFPLLPGEEDLPCIENDFSRAKAFLMRQCLSSGDNLWDHLNEVLRKILVERPKDIGCTFEEFSYRVKEARFRTKTNHLLDIFIPPRNYSYSQKLMQLLQPINEQNAVNKEEGEEEEGKVEPDIMEMFYYFEQGGVILPKEEVFCIGVHLKKLTTSYSVEKYRFWGKILGTQKNYYVAETELNEEEISKLNAEREEELEKVKLEQQEKETTEKEEIKMKRETELEEAKEREIQFAIERSDAKYDEMVKEANQKGLVDIPERIELSPWPPIPPLPMTSIKKTVECPPEPLGTGVNKKVYFVCQQPGDEWIQLPDVTPQEIVTARKIRRAFTGDLESEVASYPSFPGKEKNLLRAQIARISAGTQISPLGYYTFNEEEEEEEAETEVEEGKRNYNVNPDFEPVAIRDLVDPSMAFWVHHTQYILQQGRTTWWNSSAKEETGEDEGEAEEEEEGDKEIGPELLTPLSEDSTLDAVVPWSVRKSSSIFPEHAVAIVRSNIWPGAYAYAVDKKFDNVYIGNGLKFSANNHSPLPLQEIQEEYPLGPEIMEILDPTPEQEEEWRLAHEVKQEALGEEEEEAEDDTEMEDDED